MGPRDSCIAYAVSHVFQRQWSLQTKYRLFGREEHTVARAHRIGCAKGKTTICLRTTEIIERDEVD